MAAIQITTSSHFNKDPIRFYSLRSRFNSIRFDSNEYISVVNRYNINHFVPNLTAKVTITGF